MPLDFHTVFSTARMMERTRESVLRLLDKPLDGAVRLPVYVIAGTPWANESVSREISAYAPFGIKTTTFHELVRELGRLFLPESSKEVASPDEVALFMEPVARKATGLENASSTTATLLVNFMGDLPYADSYEDKLANSSLKAACVAEKALDGYRRFLEDAGKASFHDALAELLASPGLAAAAPNMQIVVQAPDLNDRSQKRFYERLGNLGADIVILEKKYIEGFAFPVPDESAPERFVEVNGHHALGFALGKELERLASQEVGLGDIIITMKDTSLAEGAVIDEVVGRFGFPVGLTYVKPAVSHAYGNALFVLFSKGADDYAMRWQNFAAGPLSGMTEEESALYGDASTPQEVIARWGMAEGLCEPMDEDRMSEFAANLPEDAAAQLDASPFLSLCRLASAKKSPAELPVLLEAATSKLRENMPEGTYDEQDISNIESKFADYFASCSLYGLPATGDQLMRLTLRIRRVYHPGDEPADQDDAVLVTSEAQVPFSGRRHIIMCDLDMSKQASYLEPTAFHKLEEELGLDGDYDRWAAQSLSYVSAYDVVDTAQRLGGSATFVYETRDTDGAELPHSAILDDLMDRYGEEELEEISISYSEREAGALEQKSARNNSRHHEITDSISPRLTSEMLAVKYNGKTRNNRFSPTEVEAYWGCPYKWFLSRNGAGYDEPADDAGYAPKILGSLVHEVMENFYKGRRETDLPQHLSINDIPSLDATVDAVVDDVVSKYAAEHWAALASDQLAETMREATEAATRGTMTLLLGDIDFAPGFHPEYCELPVSCDYAGAGVSGIIDRVDIRDTPNDDGRHDAIIIDYKGKTGASFGWENDLETSTPISPLHIQAYMYASALEFAKPELRVVGVVYRSYKGDPPQGLVAEEDGRLLFSGAEPGQKYKNRCYSLPYAEFRQALADLEDEVSEMMGQMKAGQIARRPYRGKKEACSFCLMSGSCDREVS